MQIRDKLICKRNMKKKYKICNFLLLHTIECSLDENYETGCPTYLVSEYKKTSFSFLFTLQHIVKLDSYINFFVRCYFIDSQLTHFKKLRTLFCFRQNNLIARLRERNLKLEETLIHNKHTKENRRTNDQVCEEFKNEIQRLRQQLQEFKSERSATIENLQRKLGYVC